MRFRRSDAVALIVVPLVVVAVTVGSEILPIICLCLGALIVYAIAGHHELLWQRRVAVCGVAAVLDLAVASYLYRVNLATELKQQVAPLLAAALPPPVSSNCPIPKGAVALYLGNTVSVITAFPMSFSGFAAMMYLLSSGTPPACLSALACLMTSAVPWPDWSGTHLRPYIPLRMWSDPARAT